MVFSINAISISHILTVLFYCNYSEMQCQLKKICCRRANKNENIEDLEKRNQEIGNWYKLLFEMVFFYGEKTKQKKEFYHGLNCHLYFSRYQPYIFMPVSTTISLDVAKHFAEDDNLNGIVLTITQKLSKSDYYLDCEDLSDFPNEKEMLFFKASNMGIIDITEMSDETKSNNLTILSFILYENLLNGKYIRSDKGNKKKNKLISKILNENE